MAGRYIMMDVKGKMEMPGANGKMQAWSSRATAWRAMTMCKKKFVGTWLDNMGTGIMMFDGTYDEANKTFSFTGEYEPMPGMQQKIRQTLKLTIKIT